MRLRYFMAVAMLGTGLLSAPVQADEYTQDHLKCFDLDVRGKYRDTEWVKLYTDAGSERCKVEVEPELLCAAAAKKHENNHVAASTVPPPPATGDFLCHELKKCYEDKYHKNKAEVSDQFGDFKVRLKDAEYLCAPVEYIKYY